VSWPNRIEGSRPGTPPRVRSSSRGIQDLFRDGRDEPQRPGAYRPALAGRRSRAVDFGCAALGSLPSRRRWPGAPSLGVLLLVGGCRGDAGKLDARTAEEVVRDSGAEHAGPRDWGDQNSPGRGALTTAPIVDPNRGRRAVKSYLDFVARVCMPFDDAGLRAAKLAKDSASPATRTQGSFRGGAGNEEAEDTNELVLVAVMTCGPAASVEIGGVSVEGGRLSVGLTLTEALRKPNGPDEAPGRLLQQADTREGTAIHSGVRGRRQRRKPPGDCEGPTRDTNPARGGRARSALLRVVAIDVQLGARHGRASLGRGTLGPLQRRGLERIAGIAPPAQRLWERMPGSGSRVHVDGVGIPVQGVRSGRCRGVDPFGSALRKSHDVRQSMRPVVPSTLLRHDLDPLGSLGDPPPAVVLARNLRHRHDGTARIHCGATPGGPPGGTAAAMWSFE
jgi:hypothetical protein